MLPDYAKPAIAPQVCGCASQLTIMPGPAWAGRGGYNFLSRLSPSFPAMSWDPTQYLKFAGERLRPALDLLTRIRETVKWADVVKRPGAKVD